MAQFGVDRYMMSTSSRIPHNYCDMPSGSQFGSLVDAIRINGAFLFASTLATSLQGVGLVFPLSVSKRAPRPNQGWAIAKSAKTAYIWGSPCGSVSFAGCNPLIFPTGARKSIKQFCFLASWSPGMLVCNTAPPLPERNK